MREAARLDKKLAPADRLRSLLHVAGGADMGKFVAAVVIGWLSIATAIWYAPVSMTHIDGTLPKQETYRHACAFDEPGLENCTDTSSYLWLLPADGDRVVSTTWKTGRSDLEAVTGTLIHENPGCADSRVEWTIATKERTRDTLTGDHPEAQLDIPVSQPLDQLTLIVRRLDSAPCGSALRWTDPRLKPSFRLLP